jgi:Xaa-Pro dipeptidase
LRVIDFTAAYDAHLAALQTAYASAMAKVGVDAIVIHSGTAKSRTTFDDQYWPLRAVPHFQHWLPLAEPDCALVIVPGQKPRLLWLREQNFWENPGAPEGTHWQHAFDIVHVHTREALVKELPRAGRVVVIAEELPSWGVELAPPALVKTLDQLRVKKSEYELLCLREANARASVGHKEVARLFFDGDYSELDLHLAYLKATAQDDPETPYKNIFALNEHAATLHHVSYGRQAAARAASSLLVDAGASCFGYASDITRTYVKGKDAHASAFGQLIASVEKLQQQLCADIAVGTKYEALHDRAHEYVGAALVAANVVNVSAEAAVATGLTRAFLPHGLGHSLGLQCHDVGCAELAPRADNPFLRNTTTITPGQVFTIEPGIYFIDMLLRPLRASRAGDLNWQAIGALSALGGIRIEDDLYVKKVGTENLTRAHL